MDTQNQVMEALAQALGPYLAVGQKAQTVGNPVGPYLHGPGGLFGVAGLSQPIISTHTQIISSVAATIPVQTASKSMLDSGEISPLAAYITGFLRSDQQEKDAVCDDPPPAGNMKTCILTTRFGRKEFRTRQVEVNRIGQTINRGEFLDLNLVNSPLVAQLGGIMMQRFALGRQDGILAGREMVARIVEVGVAFQRWICPTTFTGNPTNNSAGGGYKEFPGLDLLIATGKRDALTNATCPSLDSDVKDFNYANVSSPTTSANIVYVLTAMYRFLNHKASTQNLGPVDWRLAMRTGLFHAIADMWPCVYNTFTCGVIDTSLIDAVPSVDSAAMRRMSDEMREGKFLLIDGRRIPVILDDCITEETTADNAAIPIGGFSSDIYFLPYSVRGGSFQTLYWEFYDYSKGVMAAIRDANATSFFWSDAGRFLWSLKSPDNWCLELIAKMEPRLRLLTPQLAGRLQNVVYVPLQHYDDPLPSQDYHVDGGISTGYPQDPSPFGNY